MTALRHAVLPLPAAPDDTSAQAGRSFHCDSCGRTFAGEPGGAGLFVWTRGDEVRYEEPPLCDNCAYEISIGALIRWSIEEEEEG